MKHPFKVGGQYRNRHDEYEVVSLDEPDMVIQYSDGSVLETNVRIQARIWRNIQMEERVRKSARAARARRRRRRRRKRGGKFQGLQEHDFQSGVKGTSWRARTGLGGLLARRMSETTQYDFQSYAIYRRPEAHIVQPAYYDKSTREREAKFLFALDSQRARYGFYIEKNGGPMDDTWDWLRFIDALDSDTSLQQEVEAAMRQLELHWVVHELAAQVRVAQEGLVWEWQDAESHQGDEAEDISWPDFINRLRAIEAEQYCSLYLCAYMDKDPAIAAGVRIVDPVAKVYQALLPLYEVSTRGAD